MMRVLALARITFWEGVRNRSVYGILLFALLIFAFNIAVAGFFMRDIGKITIDMNLSALNFAGLLLVFFVAINLVAKDIDKRTIHLVLSKPLSREEYILGKYCGLFAFVMVSLLSLFALSFSTVLVIKTVYGDFFSGFSWLAYWSAAFFVLVELSVLVAVVVFFASLTTNSFINLIFSVSTYLVGTVIEEVSFFLKTKVAVEELADAAGGLDTFIDMIKYILPNFSAFNLRLEAAHGIIPSADHMALLLGYALIYIALLLAFSALIFRRREFN